MPKYMKAYYLKDLRRFPGWTEPARPASSASSGSEDAEASAAAGSEDEIVYLQEDYTVTAEVHGDLIFDGQADGWPEFCRNDLAFAVPDWEAESQAVRKALTEAGIIGSNDAAQPSGATAS